MARTDYQLNQVGRLFISGSSFAPRLEYAGAARIDGLQAKRTVGQPMDGHVAGSSSTWTGSMTARSWLDNPLRLSLLDGGRAFVDMMLAYGEGGDMVDLTGLRRAVTIEDATVSDFQSSGMSTIGSDERAVVDETYSFVARGVYTIDIPDHLGALPDVAPGGSLIHGVNGMFVAGAVADNGDLFLLNVQYATPTTDIFTLYLRVGGEWTTLGLGTLTRSPYRYNLVAGNRHLYYTTGNPDNNNVVVRAINMESLRRMLSDSTESPSSFQVYDGTVLTMRSLDGKDVIALLSGGGVLRIDDLTRRVVTTTVPGVSGATAAAFGWATNSYLFRAGNYLYTSDEYGRRRDAQIATANPVSFHMSPSCSQILSYHVDGKIYESNNRGGFWSLTNSAGIQFISVAFATRSVAYAIASALGAGASAANNLYISVSGGRRWQKIDYGGASTSQLYFLLPLLDGGVLAMGRIGSGGVQAGMKACLYMLTATKQTIASN